MKRPEKKRKPRLPFANPENTLQKIENQAHNAKSVLKLLRIAKKAEKLNEADKIHLQTVIEQKLPKLFEAEIEKANSKEEIGIVFQMFKKTQGFMTKRDEEEIKYSLNRKLGKFFGLETFKPKDSRKYPATKPWKRWD